MRLWLATAIVIGSSSLAPADEQFVAIQRVSGNQIALVVQDSRGGNPGGAGARRGGATSRVEVITLPAEAKVTSASRERRTFEFRVGAELAGGLKHRVFQDIKAPLTARLVTVGNRITELNVVIAGTDINQSGADSQGQTVIAVRPKRPPLKRP